MLSRARRAWVLGGLAMLIGLPACQDEIPREVTSPDSTVAYIGSQACAGCHEDAYRAWSDSHHALAMAEPSQTTVLGRFDGVPQQVSDQAAVFSESEGRYAISVPDGDGLKSYPVEYTFGAAPLQQYLLGYPGGRLQAFSIAWDARTAADGGQRWFHLHPDEVIPASDPLHWTGLAFNWNSNCADCHSTGVTKGYDPQDQTFNTQFIETTVGCEACHGPGSEHALVPQSGDYGEFLAQQQGQVNACAPCHSRRSQLAEGFTPALEYLDFYRPALVGEPLYHADGQILDEVYVYGSFLQSRMHRQGVRCTNCHEPHGAGLRVEGNGLCMQCHSEAANPEFPTLTAKVYDDPSHHFHEPESPGAQCVACHMPERVYMGVDGRRDHSFRMPRPDLTDRFGVPNACSGCHQDRTADWAEQAIRSHAGPLAREAVDWAQALSLASARDPEAERMLAEFARNTDQSALLRGSVLATFLDYRRGYSSDAIRAGLNDPEPLVRMGALESVARLEPGVRKHVLLELLDDPVAAIRIDAARAAAQFLSGPLPAAEKQRIEQGLLEYIAVQDSSAERPEALTNVAIVESARGETVAAEQAYRQALEIQPMWIPARVNLADLLRQIDREPEARQLLTDGLALLPDSAELEFALALSLIRSGAGAEALRHFESAARLESNVRYTYAWALALNSTAQPGRALAVLADGLERFPDHPEMLYATATLHRDLGDSEAALESALRLVELYPLDSRYQGLIVELSRPPGR